MDRRHSPRILRNSIYLSRLDNVDHLLIICSLVITFRMEGLIKCLGRIIEIVPVLK